MLTKEDQKQVEDAIKAQREREKAQAIQEAINRAVNEKLFSYASPIRR